MRLEYTSDAGGDFRLRILPDKRMGNRQNLSESPSLVCSSELQDRIYPASKPVQAGHGILKPHTKFTRLAKKRLNEYGALIDQGTLTNCVFLTGTLPGSTLAAVKALAMWSSWVTSRLSQWFRDRFPGALYFGVWEYQKRGALHLHVCVRVKTTKEARLLKKLWKSRWIALLDKVGLRSETDLFQRAQGDTWQRERWKTRTDAQTVEKSVARYLSKYCSKTNDKLRRKAAFPPASWWFACQEIREMAESVRIEVIVPNLSLGQANALFDRLGGFMVSLGTSAYPLFNNYDYRQRGLICLGPPAVAGMCSRVIKGLLPVIEPSLKCHLKDCKVCVGRVSLMFGGTLYQ